MSREIIIPFEGGHKDDHPFFHSSPFIYRISYQISLNRTRNIEYSSPHEIILNLKSYRPSDLITYINRETGKDLFTVDFDKFNLMLAESMLGASAANLEMLYGRLILTNHFSKAIADRGRFRHYHDLLRNHLQRLKAGVDSYLAYEHRKVVLYLKCRRDSVHFLTCLLQSKMEENDILFCHINIPNCGSTLSNQGLLVELIRLHIPRSKFRLYSYDPHPEEDNIITTDISREIIQIINQLVN